MAYDMEADISDIPPPDKLGKGGKPMGTETPSEESEEDKAARVSAGQAVMDALKSDDAEAFCNALDDYLDIARR